MRGRVNAIRTFKGLVADLRFNKFNDGEDDLEGNFKAWVYDVICEVNIVESIHYRPDTEDYTQIIPEICLSDLSN